jgi:hypothetical protein
MPLEAYALTNYQPLIEVIMKWLVLSNEEHELVPRFSNSRTLLATSPSVFLITSETTCIDTWLSRRFAISSSAISIDQEETKSKPSSSTRMRSQQPANETLMA